MGQNTSKQGKYFEVMRILSSFILDVLFDSSEIKSHGGDDAPIIAEILSLGHLGYCSLDDIRKGRDRSDPPSILNRFSSTCCSQALKYITRFGMYTKPRPS